MADFEVVQNLNKGQFSELVDICFQFLSGKQQPSQCTNLYQKFSERHKIELATVEPLIKSLLKISKDGIKFCKTSSQLQEELKKISVIDEHIQIFLNKWEKDYSELVQATTASAIDVNPLVDMEWKFGVTSASSELNTVGNVFLHLKLEVDKGNSKTERVFFEVQLPEFYAFLHEMERARASLDYLS